MGNALGLATVDTPVRRGKPRAGGGGGGTGLSDQFADPNGTSLDAHTMDLGAGWTEHTGNWDIQTNRARCATAANNAHASADAGIAEGEVYADLTWGSGAAYGGLVARKNGTSYWELQIDAIGSQALIGQNNAGVRTNQDSSALTVLGGETYRLRGELSGSTIALYVNEIERARYAAATMTQTATRHGLWTWGDVNNVNHRWDNFVARSTVGPALSTVVGDAFTGSNGTSLDAHAPDTGSLPTEHAGQWDLQGGQARCVTPANEARATWEAGAANVDVQVDLLYGADDGLDATGYAGLAVRHHASNGSHYEITLAGSEQTVGITWNNGAGSRVGVGSVSFAIGMDTTFALRVRCYNTTLAIYVDGTEVLVYDQATNNTTATRHGLWTWNNAENDQHRWDNLSIKSIT